MQSSVYSIVYLLVCALMAGNIEKQAALFPQAKHTIGMDINLISLEFSNQGSLGENGKAYYPKGTELSFLFTGGILLSGYVNDSLRTAGIFDAWRIREFVEGIAGVESHDVPDRFFMVNSQDGKSSEAFREWKTAVAFGAPFEDLNQDGHYDPTIDSPPQHGDKLVWCVFHGEFVEQGYSFQGSEKPLDVEVQQTLWAYNSKDYLGDIVFIHYRFINRSYTDMQDLIFSSVQEGDIGDYNDDLIGCDSILQMGYFYNYGTDEFYLDKPPSMAIQILNGILTSEQNVTSTHWDIATGATIQKQNMRDVNMSSFMYPGYLWYLVRPDAEELRYFQIGGLLANGSPLDPLNFDYGNGATASTDPKYLFSGDPVSGQGWINSFAEDKNFMVNSGQFDLAAGDTMDILLAMIVARGNDALDSITEVRKRARFLQRMLHEDARELRIYCKQDSFDMDFAVHLEAQAMGLTKASQLPVDTKIEWSVDQKPQDGVAVLLALDSLKAVFQAYRPGAYTIKALLTHKGGETDTIYKTLYATDGPSGLDSDEQTAGNFHLEQNYPNPFNPSTTIVYELPRQQQVTIEIFDSAGRKVATLLNGPQNAGRHELNFNAAHLASGVYYYRLSAGGFVQTKKMLVLK